MYRMSFLSAFTNWSVGGINGYNSNGLPSEVKYGTVGLTSLMGMIRVIGNIDIKVTPGQRATALFIVVPLVMGTNFCIGHQLGKAIRYSEGKKYISPMGLS